MAGWVRIQGLLFVYLIYFHAKLFIAHPGEGVLHYGVRWGCVPVLGSFWPENSGIGIYFYLKISVIGVYFHLEFSRDLGFTVIIKILVMGAE